MMAGLSRRLRQWRLKAQKLNEARNCEQIEREQDRQRREVHNLRPRHAVMLPSSCEAELWKACGRHAKCEICKSKFKPLRNNQLAIRASPIDGRGLFLTALRGIDKGRVITIVEGRRRRKRLPSQYAYRLNAKEYIEPRGKAKFVNQCNKPNSGIEKWNYENKENIAIIALRRIEYNEEITIDYRDETRRYKV
jgi:SET domain